MSTCISRHGEYGDHIHDAYTRGYDRAVANLRSDSTFLDWAAGPGARYVERHDRDLCADYLEAAKESNG